MFCFWLEKIIYVHCFIADRNIHIADSKHIVALPLFYYVRRITSVCILMKAHKIICVETNQILAFVY